MAITPNTHVLESVLENKPSGKLQKTTFGYILTWCLLNWRSILAEFVSTALLVLFGCMAVIPADLQKPNSPLYVAVAFGLVVMFNIVIFGHISGAYMNPSITLVAVLMGKISIILGIIFLIVQCSGAILGYYIIVLVSPFDLVPDAICVTMPHEGLNLIQAMAIEAMLTAVLSLITCAVWDPVNKHKQDSVPIKFGLAVAGLAIVGGQLTNCSMNPARSLAPALFSGKWTAHYVYWFGPMLGAALATLIYKYIWLSKEEKRVPEEEPLGRY